MAELLQFPWENPLFALSEKQSLLFAKLIPHAVALACFQSENLRNDLLPSNESAKRGVSLLRPSKSIEDVQKEFKELIKKSSSSLCGKKGMDLFNAITGTIKEDLVHLAHAKKTTISSSKEEERLWLKWTALAHFDASNAPAPAKKKM